MNKNRREQVLGREERGKKQEKKREGKKCREREKEKDKKEKSSHISVTLIPVNK